MKVSGTKQRNRPNYWIKDIKLAPKGELLCKEALKEMDGLAVLENKYQEKQPLKGVNICGSVLVSYETANFIILLKKLGANVRWCSDSLHYSVDEACAYVASQDIPIFAKRGLTKEEYVSCFERAVDFGRIDGKKIFPDFIIDDGAEFTEYMLEHSPEKIKGLKAMLEQTTSGITLMTTKFMKNGKLDFPIIDINDSVTKAKFDNIYGSRESLIEGIQNSTNIQLGGKKVIVFGYGEVGKGCAQVMRGVGSHVSIVEIDPIMAMQAIMDGYDLVSKDDACKDGEIFITATGCIKTIDEQEISKMKSGAVLMNMSEHDMEINSHFFRNNKKLKKVSLNKNCDKYIFPDGKEIYLLCDGYIVNLYAGLGHPPKVMGITFTNHILALLDFIGNTDKYSKGAVYKLTRKIDEEVARICFPELSTKLNKLTAEQAEYLGVNINGPFKRDDYRY